VVVSHQNAHTSRTYEYIFYRINQGRKTVNFNSVPRLNITIDTLTVPLFILLLFFFAVVLWYQHNKRIFFPDRGELSGAAEQSRQNDLAARRVWIESQHFETTYLSMLGHILYGIANSFTHDKGRLEQNDIKKKWTSWLFGVHPFTEGSYLLCLRLALIYPWLAFYFAWLLTGSGEFLGLLVLPSESSLIDRLAMLALFILVLWSFLKIVRSQSMASWKYLMIAIVVIITIAIAVAFTIDGAGAFTVAGAGAGAVAVASAGASAGAGAAAFAVAFAFAVAVSGAFAGTNVGVAAVAGAITAAVVSITIRNYCARPHSIAGYWIILNLFYLLMSALIISLVLHQDITHKYLSLIVFIVILPFINAFVDWLSLGVTRGLLHAIHQGSHNSLIALLFVGFDVVLALFFCQSSCHYPFYYLLASMLLLCIGADIFSWTYKI